MCPACVASVASLAWIAGGAASTGTVAAVVARKLRGRRHEVNGQTSSNNDDSAKEKQ